MSDKPLNLVILTCDEMRGDCQGYAGNPDCKTPSLDRFAERGVVFDSHFAVHGKCVPSRIAMVTGRYCHTDGYRTIWAEDATVFMESAFTHGFWASIFEPYAGYLNVVPRLIGGFGTVIPLQDAAAFIAVASAFCAALSGLAVWFGSAGHVRDP